MVYLVDFMEFEDLVMFGSCLGYFAALLGATFGATFVVMIFWAVIFGLMIFWAKIFGMMIFGVMMFGVMTFGLMISLVILLGVMGVIFGAIFLMFCFGDCLDNF